MSYEEPEGCSLPTYEHLMETEKGPNSRFGRWQGWIEKRAAERYLDEQEQTPDEQRPSGWGERIITNVEPPPPPAFPEPSRAPRRTNTNLSVVSPVPDAASPVLEGEVLSPCRITLQTFGSRFLPHSCSPINTLLPVLSERFLLFGTPDGFSFLDILPGLHGGLAGGGNVLRPSHELSDARRGDIWQGTAVWQTKLLEEGDTDVDDENPQGVVLALVDGESESGESIRVIRMYKLDNLTRLVQWFATHKDAVPLQISRKGPNTLVTSSPKRQRPHSGLARSFRAWISDNQATASPEPEPYLLRSVKRGVPSSSQSRRGSNASERKESDDSTWDIVEDLPLRWATDFIPLAGAKSRLSNVSVLFFELWKNDGDSSKGNAMLAVATKQNILLYETPIGERAFRYVKEFYTPIPAKSMSFMRQRHSDTIVARSVSHSVKHDDHQHSYASLHSHHLHRTHGSVNGTTQRSHSFRNSVVHTSQLSLFVVFDKKAIVIRVADSAVDEIELWEDPTMREMGSPSSFRMSTSSTFDGPSKDQRGPWAPFSHLEIPIANQSLSNGPTPPPKEQFVGFLTRGKRTQIVHHPLRLPLAPPFRIVSWSSPPTHVIPRVLSTDMGEPSVLQLTAIGLDGVEVQELNLPFILGSSKGKGKAASEEPIRVLADVGDAGLLCHGGRWHEHGRPPRAARKYSDDSFDSSITRPRTKTHCGVYAWSKKGTDDWRVFWLGGSGEA